MNAQTRMSPMTAFFIGLFGFGAVGIASGTAIVLFSLSVIDSRTSEILGFTETTIGETLENLPELIDSLPGIVQDAA